MIKSLQHTSGMFREFLCLKKAFNILLLLTTLQFSYAQNNQFTGCGTESVNKKLMQDSSFQKKHKAIDKQIRNYAEKMIRARIAGNRREEATLYTIPVENFAWHKKILMEMPPPELTV